MRASSRHRLFVLLLAWVGLAAAAGCTAGAPSRTAHSPTVQASGWAEPDRYTFRMFSTSGERPGTGNFRLTVDNAKIVEAVHVDDRGRPLGQADPRHLPTLGQLVTKWRTAREGHADVARAVFAADGHPAEVHIDWMKHAIDDEADYYVTEYRELH